MRLPLHLLFARRSSSHTLHVSVCLQDVLELLIEVAESYPKFLRKHLQELVSAMMQVRCRP
jgi:hypothetical protein